MNTARSHMAVAVLRNKLYVIGGCCERGQSKLVECYDPDDDKWNEVQPMNEPRANAGVGILGNKIFVMGGQNMNGDDLDTVEVYDSITQSWTLVKIYLISNFMNYIPEIFRKPSFFVIYSSILDCIIEQTT